MNNRKNYNSIVFLTTLSVYLGLVLAGGAVPSVLAQAATTRGFDIKNEIVVEDDLDKKPNDENLVFTVSTNDYLNNFRDIVEDLQKYHQNKGIDLYSDVFDLEWYASISCNSAGEIDAAGGILRNVEHAQIERAINSNVLSFFKWETDCDSDAQTTQKEQITSKSKAKVSYDLSHFSVELSFTKVTPQAAKLFAEDLREAHQIYKVNEKDVVTDTAYQNTQIRAENNQVFIVTRLPRASIDDLLAKKDAQ